MIERYIAAQTTREGLDEFQRLAIAYQLNQFVAIAGTPGVGKTDSIEVFIREFLGKKDVLGITCAKTMTETPFIGYPKLVNEGGASVTVYEDGIIGIAMDDDCPVELDEVDQLAGDLQKRLNSAADDRREIRRRDGVLKTAKGDGFCIYLSFNPDKMRRQDLEDSVADRYFHMRYADLPSSIETYVALSKAGVAADYPDNTETRGISVDNGLEFLRRDRSRWVNMFTGRAADQPSFVYRCIKPDEIPADEQIEHPCDDVTELATKLVGFINTARTLHDSGTNKLSDEASKALGSAAGSLQRVRMHRPTPRTSQIAIAQAHLLSRMGMDKGLLQSYATCVAIDQIAYGNYGTHEIGPNLTTQTLLETVARAEGLLLKRKQRSDL